MKRILLAVVIAASVFSSSGCSEVSSSGEGVPIPRVILNCTTSSCRNTNDTPTVTTVFTTSGCSVAPLFGAVIATSTQNYSSGGPTGYYGEIGGWVDGDGNPVSTIPSGTYSICSCIDFYRDSTPFVSCNQLGSKDNVAVGTSTALQFITSWN